MSAERARRLLLEFEKTIRKAQRLEIIAELLDTNANQRHAGDAALEIVSLRDEIVNIISRTCADCGQYVDACECNVDPKCREYGHVTSRLDDCCQRCGERC